MKSVSWLSCNDGANIGQFGNERDKQSASTGWYDMGAGAALGSDKLAAQTRAMLLSFDCYVLDLSRGCLLLNGGEVPLRPKTFAVLSFLVENAGRLVTKDEIFAAVWPNLAVTDDTLVQSIGELRRELGEDGTRLIKTIPRRGYRFDVRVTRLAAGDDLVPDATTPESAASHARMQTPSDVSQSPSSGVTFANRRWPLIAALSLVILLAAGALLLYRSDRQSLGSPHSAGSTWNPAEANARPAIAVLPFASQNPDQDRDYFADGLTQDVINALGRFSALTVMSWNAVTPYKKKAASPDEVARGLGVRYQVEGSVLHTGDRVRVSAQLVNSEGHVLWSARFDEAIADLFALQDKITTQIVGVLASRVTQIEQRRALAKPTDNLEAYEYVLRARLALQRPARAEIVEARALFRRAIALDRNYAAAYSGLAETYHLATVMGWAESPSETLGRAEELANKALSLDESDVRAHIILGRVHISHQQYEQAKAEMDRAIAVNPNDAHGLAGRGNILMWLGQTDAAIEALELARRIDPELNVVDRNALSLAYYLKGRYAAAIEEAELNLRRTEGANFTRIVLAASYAQENRAEDVARVVAAVHRLDPAFDSQEFGSKFLSPSDLEHLRDGLRKAGLLAAKADPRSKD
jgi:TolB-like protein/DNA-binding winged helix-turn-helix (wHTH) protein/cytochrome c-type biogenesis protein CcmH/NrfG